MRTVYKYELAEPLAAEQTLMMPRHAEPVHVEVQGDRVCLWACVDTAELPEARRFLLTGTGQPVPAGWKYAATWQQPPFVWHLWEAIE